MMDEAFNRERRGVLRMIAFSAVGAVGGMSLRCAGSEDDEALAFCLESEVPADGPLARKTSDGHKVFIIRSGSGKLVALDGRCTHQACEVFYNPKDDIFECPCHQGLYDSGGKPIAGPPQRPLEKYPIEVREGKVLVRFS